MKVLFYCLHNKQFLVALMQEGDVQADRQTNILIDL